MKISGRRGEVGEMKLFAAVECTVFSPVQSLYCFEKTNCYKIMIIVVI